MKKLLYIFDASDWESRIEVAKLAKTNGLDVIVALINGDKKSDDFKILNLNSGAGKFGALSTIKMVKNICAIISEEKPNIIHVVTLKYSFIAGIAAFNFKSLNKIYTLAGLGYLFRGGAFKSKILRALLRPFITLILRQENTKLIFQNSDDLELMINGKYARRENCTLIKGSGVYLDRFTPKASNINKTRIVLMPTRLVHEKGVAIFIAAAKILKNRDIDADFQIAGGVTKHNPRSISELQMQEMLAGSDVSWLGRVNNMPELLSNVSLIVYPSYYGEGVPRVLLESCASGRAIITTDHAGCREAVEHGVNGLLVPIKDAKKTAAAIEKILSDNDLRASMENESRKLAEKEFDINIIARKTVEIYKS